MAFPAVTSVPESDVVITAMVLGMAREILGGKKPLKVIASNDDQLTTKLQPAVASLNAALKTMGIKNIPDLKASAQKPEDWVPGSFITGKQHGKGLPGSLMSEKINYIELTYEVVSQTSAPPELALAREGGNLPRGALYLGPGAYTGMLIVDKVAKYVGSTFEAHPLAGVTGIPITGVADTMEKQGGNNVGYCHGMIQAAYAAGASDFKGITIEVAAGLRTRKLASCFGCTTFMMANDRMPDGIHLGEAASWSPIDPGNEWAIARINERFLDRVDGAPDRTAKLKGSVTVQNKNWATKCASWLHFGTTIDKALINDNHKKAWDLLCTFVQKENPASGTALLNALGFKCGPPAGQHGDDFDRVTRTLKAAG